MYRTWKVQFTQACSESTHRIYIYGVSHGEGGVSVRTFTSATSAVFIAASSAMVTNAQLVLFCGTANPLPVRCEVYGMYRVDRTGRKSVDDMLLVGYL